MPIVLIMIFLLVSVISCLYTMGLYPIIEYRVKLIRRICFILFMVSATWLIVSLLQPRRNIFSEVVPVIQIGNFQYIQMENGKMINLNKELECFIGPNSKVRIDIPSQYYCGLNYKGIVQTNYVIVYDE